eukprot:gnl/MRDRNA2_/MRDRNA2_77833_c0_seq1.p1 gnl/MRDRNA2_/MRDRNA2_77833_c0~~gnl/MRDRNA2_/MRDRNA2_77833_c0_seq1.p1  ORF type:complete len:914 (+),score=179.37 gnl/MRDRNA2_/MRDRNA2_77833_c0_seq1:92-2743(+)
MASAQAVRGGWGNLGESVTAERCKELCLETAACKFAVYKFRKCSGYKSCDTTNKQPGFQNWKKQSGKGDSKDTTPPTPPEPTPPQEEEKKETPTKPTDPDKDILDGVFMLAHEGEKTCLRSKGSGSVLAAGGECGEFTKSGDGNVFGLTINGGCVDYFAGARQFGVYGCHGGANQKFRDSGSGILCNDASGKCLEVIGAHAGDAEGREKPPPTTNIEPSTKDKMCHVALWDGDCDLQKFAFMHAKQYADNMQLSKFLSSGGKMYHYFDFDNGFTVPGIGHFQSAKETEVVSRGRWKFLSEMGEPAVNRKGGNSAMMLKGIKRCADGGFNKMILQEFDHGASHYGWLYERHPHSPGMITTRDWVGIIRKGLAENPNPDREVGVIMTACSMMSLSNAAFLSELNEDNRGNLGIRYASGTAQLMWSTINMVNLRWFDSQGQWQDIGTMMKAQGPAYVRALGGTADFNVIDVFQFTKFYRKLEDLIKKLMSSSKISNVKAAARATQGGRATGKGGKNYFLGVFLKKLRSNCASRGCGVSNSLFEDVMHSYNDMFVYSDGPTDAKGMLLSAWNKNDPNSMNWAYESGLRGSGLGTWLKFCKFIVSRSLLQMPQSQDIQKVEVAKPKATLGNGVTVLRARFKLAGAELVDAIACSEWLTLDLDLKLGKKEGIAWATGKFLQVSQLQVDGAPVFAYHRSRRPAFAEVGIPVLYEPRHNRTHFKGEPKLRKGELIVDIKKVNGTWVVWKKLMLMAMRNPVDDGPESEKHLVLEEVDFSQGGQVHFARDWKPKSCSHALEVMADEDIFPKDEDFIGRFGPMARRLGMSDHLRDIQSAVSQKLGVTFDPLVVDWTKDTIGSIKLIPETLPDIAVAYKTDAGKVGEVGVTRAVV